jgi:hypothetical protein
MAGDFTNLSHARHRRTKWPVHEAVGGHGTRPEGQIKTDMKVGGHRKEMP